MSIQEDPHYELPAATLASWIERQGTDCWWNVDGDSYLTGRVAFPCPGDELAAALRRTDRSLLVLDKRRHSKARGEVIGEAELDELVKHLGDDSVWEGEKPTWAENRILLLSWKGFHEVWLLIEDRETTQTSRLEASASGEDR